jgi:hypothetical protein
MVGATMPAVELYGDDGAFSGERWLASDTAAITTLVATGDGALVFVAGEVVGLTEPIE